MQKLRLFLGLSILGLGTGIFWFWRQATYIPEWYTQSVVQQEVASMLSGTNVAQTNERQALKARLAQQAIPRQTSHVLSSGTRSPVHKPSSDSQVTHEVTLDPTTFGEFVVSSIPQTPQSELILPAIKGINTEIDAGKLKIGVVVNTSELPLDQLTEETQSQLQSILATFPFLKEKEIYLGISGQPSLESGQVVLGQNTKVQVGGLTMDLNDASEKMGIPIETLERKIYLQLGQLKIQDISLIEKNAVLRGALD